VTALLTIALPFTNHVFWNNPSEQQKKVQLGLSKGNVTDLGDKRNTVFAIGDALKADMVEKFKTVAAKAQTQFVHYVGQFGDMRARFENMAIELDGQIVAPHQIKHYDGTRLTSTKFAVESQGTTHVSWNDPSEQQKKIQLNMKVSTAVDLGDMRDQFFSAQTLRDPDAPPVFKEARMDGPQARADWKPSDARHKHSTPIAKPTEKLIGFHGPCFD